MKKIMILDGGLGTMIQAHGINTGCNDYLCVTHPEIIAGIHNQYLVAGADIISTNSFNANSVSLSEYGLQDQAYAINVAAARVAKGEAVKFGALVAGSVGGSSKSLSMSADIERPEFRDVTFDQMANAFAEQIKGLVDGGVDIILLETVFDTLNVKAAIFAIRNILNLRDFPIIISGTITDASGRILSGQTVEAFYYSIKHARPMAVGLNCAFGAKQMKPYIERLRKVASCKISAHPNAGLPNLLGGYDESPREMAEVVRGYMEDGLVDIVGGCCGTTPEYIAELKKFRDEYSPIEPPVEDNVLTLCGLEELRIVPEINFVNVGERTNVAGSAKFARLIRSGEYGAALEVAKEQIAGGAQVVDVCMDDAMIDAGVAMKTFLNLCASEPEISRVPIMIDSSHWDVILEGLKCVQGKAIVNSISLKEGEADFVAKAKMINDFGAAMVVMLFDEKGQADTFERKIEVAKRAYDLLLSNGIAPSDIVFDPNILSIATGIKQHDSYGLDFIRATEWIKKNCPHTLVSGGVSNLSFSFRGNNVVREAMHTVFLYHAIGAGMDMGIVNPSMLQVYDTIEEGLRNAVEDVVLCKDENATERLIEVASHVSAADGGASNVKAVAEISADPVERLQNALVTGRNATVAEDALLCYHKIGNPLGVIDEVLMPAMARVGDLFGQGKMFLPQVVKSARVMKEAVNAIKPYLDSENEADDNRKKIVVATVKGDVHDIGKNIVALVLKCNNYNVVDLGVMVDPDAIVENAKGADVVVLSGLITPSLEQMCVVAKKMKEVGLCVPIAIGGATTSAVHTAVKIAPLYDGLVVHSTDASGCANVIHKIFNEPDFAETYKAKQSEMVEKHASVEVKISSLDEARRNAPKQR